MSHDQAGAVGCTEVERITVAVKDVRFVLPSLRTDSDYPRHVALHLHSITMDAADPAKLANFWAGVTGYSVEMANEFVARLKGDGSVGPGFLFVKVPEGKTAKNRVHVDLGTVDLDGETARVIGLGAVPVGAYDEYGVTWSTFRDPEGNEFCIGRHEPPSH